MKYSKLFLTIIVVALIFSCTKERTTAGEFVFVATGNVQGSLNPYKIRLDSLGGLARRATFLKDLRATGTDPILLDAGNFIKTIQDRQGQQIGCLEEIAFNNKWINKNNLKKLLKIYNKNYYTDYLKKLL